MIISVPEYKKINKYNKRNISALNESLFDEFDDDFDDILGDDDYISTNISYEYDAFLANIFISSINPNWKIVTYRKNVEGSVYYNHRDIIDINTSKVIAKDVYDKDTTGLVTTTTDLNSSKNKIEFEKVSELKEPEIKDNEYAIAGEMNDKETKEKLLKAGCTDILELIQSNSSEDKIF